MYKSNIITQAIVYLMISLAKPRVFVGKSDMIYDSPSETVPEQYNEVKHILESVYIKVLVKKKYQPLGPFLAELLQKNLLFAYGMVGH